jgi:hypothetical protein
MNPTSKEDHASYEHKGKKRTELAKVLEEATKKVTVSECIIDGVQTSTQDS